MPRQLLPDVRTTALLVVVIGLLLAGSLPGAAVAPNGHLAVSSATVSNAEPLTGEPVLITPTIRHSSSGSGSVELTKVALTDATSGAFLSVSHDLGTLGPGDSIEAPLSATFDAAGRKHLSVEVRGALHDADGELLRVVSVSYPVYVTVSEPTTTEATPPKLRVEVGDGVVGAATPVTVTVSNGGAEAVSDLSLRLSSPNDRFDSETAIRPALGAGNATTFSFDVRPSEAGDASVMATLSYGDGSTVEAFDVVDVAPLRDEVTAFATVVETNESTGIRYRVTNHGNAPIEDVTVRGTAGDASLPTAAIQRVEPAASETVTVDTNGVPSGAGTIEATYTLAGTTGRTSQPVTLDRPNGTAATDGRSSSADSAGRNQLESAGGFSGITLGVFLLGAILATVAMVALRRWSRIDAE